MELRGYQERVLCDLQAAFAAGHAGAVLELGTGAGKTVTAAALVSGATAAGERVLWLAHRRELVEQALAALRGRGLELGDRLQVRTCQGRLDETFRPDLIVVDEGHRAMAPTYRRVFSRWPMARRVLLTGTALRTDGQRLAEVASAHVRGPSVGELTRDGWLVPARYWAVPGADLSALPRPIRGDFRPADLSAVFDRPEVTGDVAATYARLARGRIGVVFAASVAHAGRVAVELRRLGVPAAVVHGNTPRRERAALLELHQLGDLQVLCCADLLVEGWDHPALGAVSFARATTSPIVWRQGVGRLLRTHEGKRDGLVLDHGGNVFRHGPVEDDLEDDLPAQRGRPGRVALPLLTCAACFAVMRSVPRPLTCPRCHELVEAPKGRVVNETRGELAEVEAPKKQKKQAVDWRLWREIDADRERRGYRPGWTWTQYALRASCKEW